MGFAGQTAVSATPNLKDFKIRPVNCAQGVENNRKEFLVRYVQMRGVRRIQNNNFLNYSALVHRASCSTNKLPRIRTADK